MYTFIEPTKEITISIYNSESNISEALPKCQRCIRYEACPDIDKLTCDNNGCKHFTEELLT